MLVKLPYVEQKYQ